MRTTSIFMRPAILRLFLLLLPVMTLLPVVTLAQQNGNSVYRFLQLAPSPRTAALGGIHVSLPNADASHFTANPAYVNEDTHANIAFSYLNHIGDVNMGFASSAYHLKGIGTLAASLRFINYGEIRRADEAGNDLGSFSANDLAFSAGLSREVIPNLRIGAAGNFIYSGYDAFSSTAVALNAGLYYYFESAGLHIGAAVTNLGYQISAFDNYRENLPADVRIGVSRRLEYVPIRFSLTAHSLNRWNMETFRDQGEEPSFMDNMLRHITIGAEIMFSDNVHARIGYDHFTHEELKVNNRLDTAGFAFGVGINIRGFGFEFSRSSFSDLGGITRIGIQTYL
ncbi:MAG: type IX secretion system protein PorQ [Balneolales bacterium]|nr:type IX secretion system protein PorQ [Balneolales bacterium]